LVYDSPATFLPFDLLYGNWLFIIEKALMPIEARLDLVHKAICGGYRGQIEWQASCLARFNDDPQMKSFTEKGIKEALWDFVRNQGGKLEARMETAKEWLEEHPDDPWWYFAVLPVSEFPRGLFVKVKLLWEEGSGEEDAWAQIVSIHEEREGKVL
jgi:hypothetical protein